MTGLEITCPRCEGGGEIAHQGYSVNPFSGVRVSDPQMVETEPCPRCDGTGTVVRSRRTSARRPEPSSSAGARTLPSDPERQAA